MKNLFFSLSTYEPLRPTMSAPMPEATPPPPLESLRIRKLRGPGVPLLRHTWRASVSEETWNDLLNSTATDVRAFLQRPPDPTQWVDAELLQLVTAIFQQHAKEGLIALQAKMAAETMMDPGRGPSPVASVEALVQNFSSLWPNYFEGGRAGAERKGPQAAQFQMWAHFEGAWLFQFLRAWLLQIMRSLGHTEVMVTYQPPNDLHPSLHVYDMTW